MSFPNPFPTTTAAGTFCRKRFPGAGTMAVAPVRTRSPSIKVKCPTLTPSTSVMAFRGAGGKHSGGNADFAGPRAGGLLGKRGNRQAKKNQTSGSVHKAFPTRDQCRVQEFTRGSGSGKCRASSRAGGTSPKRIRHKLRTGSVPVERHAPLLAASIGLRPRGTASESAEGRTIEPAACHPPRCGPAHGGPRFPADRSPRGQQSAPRHRRHHTHRFATIPATVRATVQ